MDDNQREAIELIATIVTDTGLTPTQIARRSGLAPSTLTRLYPEPSVKSTLSARTLSKLRTTFDLGRSDGGREFSSVNDIRTAFDGPTSDKMPLFAVRARTGTDGALPPGTDRLFLYEADMNAPSGIIAAQGRVSGSGRYFATYMPNETMEPRYRTGEILIVDRIRPPSVGCDVWVEFSPSGETSLLTLAKLEGIERDQYVLHQYRYGDRGTVHRSHIHRIYSITGAFED